MVNAQLSRRYPMGATKRKTIVEYLTLGGWQACQGCVLYSIHGSVWNTITCITGGLNSIIFVFRDGRTITPYTGIPGTGERIRRT